MAGKVEKILDAGEINDKAFLKAAKTQMSHIFGKPSVTNPNLVKCCLFAFNIAKVLNKQTD